MLESMTAASRRRRSPLDCGRRQRTPVQANVTSVRAVSARLRGAAGRHEQVVRGPRSNIGGRCCAVIGGILGRRSAAAAAVATAVGVAAALRSATTSTASSGRQV
jgi:hypothetical protein